MTYENCNDRISVCFGMSDVFIIKFEKNIYSWCTHSLLNQFKPTMYNAAKVKKVKIKVKHEIEKGSDEIF